MNRSVAVPLACFIVGAICMAGEVVFDAASVKMSPPDAPRPYTITGGPGTKDPSRFRASHTGMSYLLQRAYGVQADQIVGPSWITEQPPSVAYEIAVTMPVETTREQFQKMLQRLLAERFHVAIHHETRHFPGYELVVDKGGPKFSEIKVIDDSPEERQSARGARGPDGFPIVIGPMTVLLGTGTDSQRIKYQQKPFSAFTEMLGPLIAFSEGLRPRQGDPVPRIVDMTGLTGNYTFTLQYSCPACNTRPSGDSGELTPGSGYPEIFKAIQQQLGLRLNKKPDVSVDVIVVDSVDKTPTAN